MNSLIANLRVRSSRGVLHIERSLPGGKGKLLVKIGQEVKPEDILGEGESAGGFTTVHLAQELGVSPLQAQVLLKPKLGQTVFRGELLAQKESLFGFKKQFLVSPADGIVDFYDNKSGILKIKFIPHKHKLVSGVFGIVDEVDANRSWVRIRTMAEIIFGVVGSGIERSGIIKVIGPAGMLVSSHQISSEHLGNILVGGGMIFLDALKKAMHSQVTGLVSGGISAADFRSMRGGILDMDQEKISDVGISVVVTEGFGSLPIGDDLYQILVSHNSKFALIDGNKARLILPINDPTCMISIRKIKPAVNLGGSVQLGKNSELRVGLKVRVIASFYMATQGEIINIDATPTLMPSGVASRMVTINTHSSGKIKMPYQNLEII